MPALQGPPALSSLPNPPEPIKPAPRAGRGIYFWLSMLLAFLIAVPLLLYIFAMSYVSLGYVKDRIVRGLANIFEGPVQVGDVRSQGLNALNINRISVGPCETSAPLKVGSVKVDYDAMTLLRESRIRSVTVMQPSIGLKRDAAGKWNIALKPREKAEGGVRLENIQFGEGDFSFEMPGADAGSEPRRIRLQAVRGTITDPGKTVPNLFSFFGVFDSLEDVTVNGSVGPGAAFSAGAFGGVNIERDLASFIGGQPPKPGRQIQGLVRFELGGRRETLLMNAERGGPLHINGRLNLTRLNWPFSENWAIAIPSRMLDFAGKVDVENPSALALLDDMQLRLDGAATLRGAAKVSQSPGLHLSFNGLSGMVAVSYTHLTLPTNREV